MKHRIAIAGALVGITTITAAVVYARRDPAAPQIVTDTATRGSIVSVIAATGTLEAVTTVQVGSQVSGTVQALNADFNSIVRKGQVLARLDPSLYQSAIDQAQANLVRAEADLDRLRVAARDAGAKLQRAALTQAQVNLEKTVIASPIDGIVISRNVDVGQTVAASLQAPTLYQIAADLTRMQLKASIDESDVGRISRGQTVTFHVDAYPAETFSGVVEQVRLNPVVESNVVTYAAIISAPNPALKLKPGMTANLTIEVARRENVLRVPAAALRLRPGDAILKALGASSIPAAQRQGSMVWQPSGTSIAPVRVRTGIGDGTYTEILDGLAEGAQVVTRVASAGDSSSTSSSTTRKTTASPLIQGGPPGPPPR